MEGAPLRLLVLGASYGLLPAIKLGLAGHAVTIVGRAEEAAAMAQGALELDLPLRRSDQRLLLSLPTAPRAAPGVATLVTPAEADPAEQDFVILAMQEPQFAAPEIAALLARIAAADLPCLSIMNQPPPPFLARLPGVPAQALDGVYASGPAWAGIAPGKLSVASPDAQAGRFDPARPGRLTVMLPSNFKAAPLADPADQRLLERLAHDMAFLASEVDGKRIRVPVALLAQSSIFAPLAKWPMLLAGNCRCLVPGGIRPIAEAVHADLAQSEAVYAEIAALLRAMGAPESDVVPFASYARAAEGLGRPSSLARALAGGALAVERTDLLALNLLRHHALPSALVEPIVAEIDARLAANRAAAAGD